MSITLSAGLRMVAIGRYMHWCGGCDKAHFIDLGLGADGQKMSFDGDLLRPTFSAPILAADERGECRYYLTMGQLQFTGDCWHCLRNQTVPLPDFPMQRLQVQPEPRP